MPRMPEWSQAQSWTRHFALSVACVLAACAGPTAPTGAGLHLSNDLVADTILSFQAVRFRVNDDAGPLARQRVVLSNADSVVRARFTVNLSTGVDSLEIVTDEEGWAEVQLRLWTKAGDGAVVARAAGYSASWPFTVLPGRAVDVVSRPGDTAVFLGEPLQVHLGPVDRLGNFTAEPATYESGRPDVATTTSDGVVTGHRVGQTFVTMTHGSEAHTIRVSVVPRGRFRYSNYHVGYSRGFIRAIDLDGGRLEHLLPFDGPNTSGDFDDGFVYWTGRDGMMVIDRGGSRIFYENADVGYYSSIRQSPDGSWLYFDAKTAFSANPTLYRLRIEDRWLEQLTFQHEAEPDISPDGSTLVYVAYRNGLPEVWTLDLLSGQSSNTGKIGLSPRWSPTGEQMVYMGDLLNRNTTATFYVAREDGSEARALPTLSQYRLPVSWSPDGDYLLGTSSTTGEVDIVDVLTGEATPLPFAVGAVGPEWVR